MKRKKCFFLILLCGKVNKTGAFFHTAYIFVKKKKYILYILFCFLIAPDIISSTMDDVLDQSLDYGDEDYDAAKENEDAASKEDRGEGPKRKRIFQDEEGSSGRNGRYVNEEEDDFARFQARHRNHELAMAEALSNLTKEVRSLQEAANSNRKIKDPVGIEERVTNKVASCNFKSTSFKKQYALNLANVLMLTDCENDDPVVLKKNVGEVVKKIKERNSWLLLADENPGILQFADAQEKTKELEELSKSLGKEARDYMMDGAGRKNRFRSAGVGGSRPFTGSSFGRNSFMSRSQAPVQRLMDVSTSRFSTQRPPSVCYSCQQPGHFQARCPLKGSSRRGSQY